MTKSIPNFLKDIQKIIQKNDEIKKLKGESFNLFDLLDRRTDEVKTHSMFIAELLNPNGSHKMGDIFLKLFFKIVLLDKCEITPNFKNVKVEVEKFIGKINEEKDEGGRLDIVLSNSNFTICIENKIYASNQPNQLERYANYLKRKKSTTILFYLTLHGTEYTNSIKGSTKLKNEKDYYQISYKKEIIEWLELCFEKSSNYPILRECIKQYIILVKSLTNQLSNNMDTEIKNEIIENLKTAEIIKDNYDNAILSITNELKNEIKHKLIEDDIFKEYQISTPINGKFSSIFIKVEDNEGIGIESFTGNGHRNGELFIGFFDFDKKVTEENQQYQYSIWVGETIQPIWDKETLFSKYASYHNGKKTEIVDEIISKIKEFKDIYVK